MIIVMVPAKVGKHGCFETAAPHPFLVQRMTRDFHNGIAEIRLHHLRQQVVEFEGVRRGVCSRYLLGPNAIIHCPNHPNRLAGRLQNRLNNIGGSRLPVGPCNANQTQVLPRMAMVGTGEQCKRLTTVGHLDHGASRLLHAVLQGDRELFHHEDGGSPVERLSEKAVPIGMHSA